MKSIHAVIFGILSLYAWNYLLIQSSQKGLLTFFYFLAGFLVMAVYSGHKKPMFKNAILLPLLTAVILSVLDIVSIGIFSSTLLLIAIADSLLKIAVTVFGGILFYGFHPFLNSKKEFLFGDLQTLSRRIVSALIDLSILLIIFAGLTLATALVRLPGAIDGILIIVVIFSYKVIQEAQSGQTPGKKLMSISVKCGPAQAAIRNIPIVLLFLAPYTSGILLNLVYIIILIDLIMIFTGKRLFDFLSGTSIRVL